MGKRHVCDIVVFIQQYIDDYIYVNYWWANDGRMKANPCVSYREIILYGIVWFLSEKHIDEFRYDNWTPAQKRTRTP